MLLRTESCVAVMALLSMGHRSMTWAADSAGEPHVQVLSCSLTHLTRLGAARAGAFLLLNPFDKFGHSRKLPCHKADAGLSGTWGQILEGATKHVTRVTPVFRRAAEGKARRPAVRASAVPIVSEERGAHLAY